MEKIENLVCYTSAQAPGAWPNGSRVRKSSFEEGDGHAIGAMATVRGSMGPVPENAQGVTYGYFLEWDDRPGLRVFCIDMKIEVVELEKRAADYIIEVARLRTLAGHSVGHATWLNLPHEKLGVPPLTLIMEGNGKDVIRVLESELAETP